jgi:hypothetical protein
MDTCRRRAITFTYVSRRARAQICRPCTSRRKFMFTSPGVLIVMSRTRPSQGLPVKRLPRAPLYFHRFFQSVQGVLFANCMPRCFVDYLLGSAIPLAHMLKKQHWSYLHPDEHPPNIAMMVRHSSISLLLIRSRRDRILWDFIESTHMPHIISLQQLQFYQSYRSVNAGRAFSTWHAYAKLCVHPDNTILQTQACMTFAIG